jgi:hypothetical protein
MKETPKSGGAAKGAGRQATPIDRTQLENLCATQCSNEEIAYSPLVASAKRNSQAFFPGNSKPSAKKAQFSVHSIIVIVFIPGRKRM